MTFALRSRLALILGLLAALGLYAAAFSAETPLGSLRGRVVARDTGQPLVHIRVLARPKAPQDGQDTDRTFTDREGRFQFPRLPIGEYEVQALTQVYENEPQPATVVEGHTAAVDLQLKPNDPFLNLNIHQHSYTPSEDPRIALHGFRQGGSLRLRLIAVNSDSLVQEQGKEIRSLLDPVSSTGKPGTFKALRRQGLRTVREWTYAPKKTDAEGVFYDRLRLGRLPTGLYLVSARGEKTECLGWVMVTDLALVTKLASHKLLAYAVDLASGKPVPGATVAFLGDTPGSARVTTDSRGLAEARVPGGETVALARRGASLAFVRLYASESDQPERYRAFVYTDRPVYRPGHRVRFKGVVRQLQGPGYGVPSGGRVYVSIRDPQDTHVYDGEVELNAQGSFAGYFMLNPEAASGYYSVYATIAGEQHEGDFVVASYRKPEWRVDVKTPKPRYIRGERVPVTIEATYYFGSPVVNGKVHYTVYRSTYWRWWGDDEELALEDEYHDDYGDVLLEGDLTTDQGGMAAFEFPTKTDAKDDPSADYQYRIEAEVTDYSQRSASGNGRVIVNRGELTLNASAAGSVMAPGDTTPVTVRVLDLEDKPAANLDLAVRAVLQTWDGTKSVEHPFLTQTVKTDAKGEASVPVRVEAPGMVLVYFRATDRRGNPVETSTDVWVTTAEGGDYAQRYADLSVMPDKKLYRTGDTAQVLINTARPGATALVSLEAEGVLDTKLVPLTRKSTVVRFPIRAGYEPNIYVTACFVKDKNFYTNVARLNVNTDAHRLKVTIESDRDAFHPRDAVTYRVRTTDWKGRPVPAEFSFGLVDESVYAIREEPKRGLWETFYPRRSHSVTTEYSFPVVYLGDAAKDGQGAIRKDFPDTAAWEPQLRTDASGQAVVKVRLPDSLTSWRATVVAHTATTEVGRATENVRVFRELTLRLQTPRSLTEGDRLTLSAVAHNFTPAAMDVGVDLKASGLKLEGGTSRKVRIEPGQAQRLTWDAQALTPGKATVTALATGAQYQDGMELTVPVRPFVREKVVYRAGDVTTDLATEEFDVDPGTVGGTVELRAAPTLAGPVLGSLDYLATYPYGCTEQTMSSFLPDVVVGRTLKGLGIQRPELQAKLPAMVQAGLLRLYRYQHEGDGGWGWWEYDETDPWMTAYVIYGLALAKEAGYAVNEHVWENGLRAAKELAKKPDLDLNSALYLAYSLARAGAVAEARPLLARLDERNASPAPQSGKKKPVVHLRSLGYAVLALLATHGSEERRQAEALLDEIWGRARTEDGVTRWNETRDAEDYHVPQDVESTAVLLQAALALNPEDPRIPGVLRWLMLQRHGDRWESTRDTAWILLALTDFLKASGELKPDYRLTVRVNGKEIHTEKITAGDALKEETVVVVPLAGMPARSRVEVRKEGEGTVYYSLKVVQQVRAPSFAAESSPPGLTVRREYFRLETKTDPQGRIVVAPAGGPTRNARVGDRLLVRLTLHTDRPLEYLMLEDPIPAGFEVQDRGQVGLDEWWNWWSHTDVRDDRVSFFIRRLEPLQKGEHRIEYYVRPEMSGSVRLLPAVLSDMYVPSTRASTEDLRLEVGQ